MHKNNDDFSGEMKEKREELENIQDDSGRGESDQAGDSSKDESAPVETGEKTVEGPDPEAADEAEAESERYLRLAAEFDNYKKRTAREFGDVVRRGNERLLRSLIEIIDSFERALSQEVDENGGVAYRRGVELIYNQLEDLLRKEQVTVIEAIGQPFDPNYHEALMQAESDEYDEGIVCQEIQKGYKFEDKVLRHARVAVSTGAPAREDEK